MDTAERVLERLERIETLTRAGSSEGAQGPELLTELRALVREAEAWARAEGDGRARAAAARLDEGVEGIR